MDERSDDLPDFAHLRQALAPVLCQRLAHVLSHAEQIMQWKTQSLSLSAAERPALLEHLAALEATASRLSALLDDFPTATEDVEGTTRRG